MTESNSRPERSAQIVQPGDEPRDRRDEALAPSNPRGRRRPRLNHFDYRGQHAYHSRGRAPVLVEEQARKTVLAIERAARSTAFDLLVFTVMPDHVHILALGLDETSSAKVFLQRFKQLSSHAFSRSRPDNGPLWQQSFYDHVVRAGEDVLPIARYIVANPVEAGLATDELAWPFTGGSLVEVGGLAAKLERDGAKAASLLRRDGVDVYGDGTE